MPISYSLYKNHLTNGSNQYRAIIRVAGSVDLEGVIDRMLDRGSTISRADAMAVLQDYHEAIESLLLDGFKINTPLAGFWASMKGNFAGPGDAFDAGRHSLEPRVSPGPQFRRFVKERLHVQKTETSKVHPNPLEYIDLNTGEINTTLTPGGMGQLSGHRLKYNPDNPAEGIFLSANGSSTRAGVVANNTAKKLIFLVPAELAPGAYELTVTCLYGQTDLRSGRLDASLLVG